MRRSEKGCGGTTSVLRSSSYCPCTVGRMTLHLSLNSPTDGTKCLCALLHLGLPCRIHTTQLFLKWYRPRHQWQTPNSAGACPSSPDTLLPLYSSYSRSWFGP